MRRLGAALVLSMASALASSGLAAAPATQPDLSSLKANDSVMVREGDSWSKATFLSREGRKYQIKYDDGTTEWVTADRLQLGNGAHGGGPAGGAPATMPAGGAPAAGNPPAAPAKPPLPTFVAGQKAELKYASRWEPVKVLNKRGNWYLVEYEKWAGWREWAEPWRLRKVGSDYDFEGWGKGTRVRNNEGPPTPEPGPSPDEAKAMAGQPGAGGDNPAKPERDNPFGPPKHAYPITDVKAQPRQIATDAPAGGWRVPVAALPAAAKLPATVKAAPLPALDFGVDWNEPSVAGTRAMVPVAVATGFKKQSGLARVNLITGGVERFELDPASAAIALSPSGDLVACRSNGFHSGSKSRLDVYRLGPKIEHVISFFPFGSKQDIQDAFWTDDQNLVLVGGDSISSWSVLTATGNWSLQTGRTRANGLSPDGKQLAIALDDGITIVNLADGAVLGKLDGKLTFGNLAYSGDGLRLFTYEGKTLRQWDLQTGLEDDSVTFTAAPPSTQLVAPSKDFLLIGDALYAVQKKAFVWQYKNGGKMIQAGGRVFVLARDGQKKMLTSAALPHPRALTAAQQSAAAPAVLKAGMAVSLDIQVDVDDAKRQEIIAGLTKQLAQSGIKVAEGAPLRLSARTEDGESVTRTYRMRRFGQPGGGDEETVTFTPRITKIRLEKDDKVYWETARSSGGDPGIIVHLKEGETIQDKVNNQKVSFDWIASVNPPSLILDTGNLATLPSSTFALGGVVDAK